jgi:transcription initiation factor TFIIB
MLILSFRWIMTSNGTEDRSSGRADPTVGATGSVARGLPADPDPSPDPERGPDLAPDGDGDGNADGIPCPTEAASRPDEVTDDSESRVMAPICPECDAPTFDAGAAHRELVCRGCGLVVDANYLDRGLEWRADSGTAPGSAARTGGPTTALRHDRGLSTTVDWRDRDAKGNPLSAAGRRRADSLRRWHRRIQTDRPGEVTLRQMLGEVARMGSALGVPDPIREVAGVICRRVRAEGAVRGRSIEGLASGALYAAARRSGAPRSLDEVADVSRVDRREVGRTYKHLTRELDLELAPPHPRAYVGRYRSDLGVSPAVGDTARSILAHATRAGLVSGKSPTGYAGAAVLAATLLAGRDRRPHVVAEVVGVSAVTIRTRTRELLVAVGSEAIAAGLLDDDPLPADWRSGLAVTPAPQAADRADDGRARSPSAAVDAATAGTPDGTLTADGHDA